jgi:hypothetical protein
VKITMLPTIADMLMPAFAPVESTLWDAGIEGLGVENGFDAISLLVASPVWMRPTVVDPVGGMDKIEYILPPETVISTEAVATTVVANTWPSTVVVLSATTPMPLLRRLVISPPAMRIWLRVIGVIVVIGVFFGIGAGNKLPVTVKSVVGEELPITAEVCDIACLEISFNLFKPNWT